MKTTETRHGKSVAVCAREITNKTALRCRLALLWAAIVCATLPVGAQPTLTVTPNPVAVGDKITVKLSGVCDYTGGVEAIMTNDPNVNVGTVVVPMAPDPNDSSGSTWIGTYWTTPTDVGYDIVTADDGECQDAISTNGLEVVWLNDVYQPWWGYRTQVYGISSDSNDDNQNSYTLQSPYFGDYDGFQLDIYPNDSSAASIVTWSADVTPLSDKRYATRDCWHWNGPATVNASVDNFTSDNITNWVFWCKIEYNCNAAFDTNDQLTFADTNLTYNLPDPRIAGSFAGPITHDPALIACDKVEIIGTLQPAGVGNVFGTQSWPFTFNPQIFSATLWGKVASPTDTHAYVSGLTDSGFVTGTTQQIVPVNDKIFAIDSPGEPVDLGTTCYWAGANTFTNHIWIGTVMASDAYYWHSFVQAHFTGDDAAFVTTPNFASGSGSLPTTWNDQNW